MKKTKEEIELASTLIQTAKLLGGTYEEIDSGFTGACIKLPCGRNCLIEITMERLFIEVRGANESKLVDFSSAPVLLTAFTTTDSLDLSRSIRSLVVAHDKFLQEKACNHSPGA